MEAHRRHAHMSVGEGGVRGWVGRGPLQSSWFCHPLARPVALAGPPWAHRLPSVTAMGVCGWC